MEDMPTDYDAIVVGTGLVESIYAAAAARVGKTVLHIDRNDHYSGQWAVLSLSGLLEWAERQEAADATPVASPPDTEPDTVPLRARQLVHELVLRWHIEEGEPEASSELPKICLPGRPVQTAAATPDDTSTAVSEDQSMSRVGPGTVQDEAPGPAPQMEGQDATPGQSASLPTESASLHAESALPTAESASPPTGSAPPPSETVAPLTESASLPAESAPPSTEPAPSPTEPGLPPTESAPPPTESAPPPTQPVSVAAEQSASLAKESASGEAPWTINRMKKLSRRFNIDLAPKVLYSRGTLVELLISSNIARYAEFRSVGQLLTPLLGQLQPVPSSRADVFTTRHVSVVEKRLLMKLLSFCLDFEKYPDEYKAFEQKPFSDFLRSRRLTDTLTHHVIHAIAMVTPQTPTLQALLSTQKFLRSLGRYGNTPFLWPMYGSGELPQCFCRMCAVFGGVYHLSRGLDALTVDATGAVSGVLSQGQRLTCRRLLLEEAYRPAGGDDAAGLSRAVLITDRSLHRAAGDQVLLIRLPAEEGSPGPVTVLQVGTAASAAPASLYLVHLTCERRESAERDLTPAVERLRRLAAADGDDGAEAAPLRVLASLFFSRRRPGAGAGSPPAGVAFCSGPDEHVGFDAAVREARELFSAHFPDEPFLPRAPDPEEIIFFDEPAESVVTGGARPTETSAGADGSTGQGDSPPAQGDRPATQGDSPPAQGDGPPARGDSPAAQGDGPPAQGDGPPARGDSPAAQGDGPPAQGDGPPAQGDGPPAQGDGPPA
ncbi:rab proteins geranylgeranyltransferase component A 2-like [Pollicipes pollicipes]|uniref:rab proteins geranylgeranyltransferase component A 2-like n=1 Tax=Pollicipes pollicipes TaxID=41117 RepID=UPI001884E072|nr:rab proteins geranylgeranyltransferase component A 2-like [Pollicipes pollicipes]